MTGWSRRTVIAALAETKTPFEINTAGWRKDCAEQYPAKEFLELAHAAGVPLLINSDAHAVEVWSKHWTTEGLATYERLLAHRPPKPFALGSQPGLADIRHYADICRHFMAIDLYLTNAALLLVQDRDDGTRDDPRDAADGARARIGLRAKRATRTRGDRRIACGDHDDAVRGARSLFDFQPQLDWQASARSRDRSDHATGRLS